MLPKHNLKVRFCIVISLQLSIDRFLLITAVSFGWVDYMSVKKNVAILGLLICFLLSLIFQLSVVSCQFVCVASEQKSSAPPLPVTIVLDAGHGGIDGGVVGVESGVKESDINLQIVKKLQIHLESAGLNVVLTRETEKNASDGGNKRQDMQKRKEIIEQAEPNAVISIHCNKFPDKNRRGAQVFFQANAKKGIVLARHVQDSINPINTEHVGRTFSALKGDYYVTNCSSYPSVIVECGFLSNPQDDRLLNSESYQLQLVEAIARGLLTYLATVAE